MSAGPLRASIEQMEAWVSDPSWVPDPDAITRWNDEFHAALAQAERGPDWSELMARAHAVGHQVESRTKQFAQIRDGLRSELDAYDRGSRALQGYKSSTR